MAVKEAEARHALKNSSDLKRRTSDAKEELEAAQSALDVADKYYHDTLGPECVNSSTSYEARVAQREAEIQSLQEALQLLDNDDK